MKHINKNSPTPGWYRVSWSEEVTRSALIEIIEDDCEGAADLQDALISAIENGGHPDNMQTDIEDQDDFYVHHQAQKPSTHSR